MWARAQFGATLAVLAALGALTGLYGAFLVPAQVAGYYGLGVAVTVVANLALTTLGAWGTGSTLGAIAPACAWAVVAYLAGSTRPTGGLVVPGGAPGVPGLGTAGSLYLLVGVVAAGIGIGLAPRLKRRRPPADS